jgi:hypothetical protein
MDKLLKIALAFKDGKITMIADATVIRIDKSAYDMTIDASGNCILVS